MNKGLKITLIVVGSLAVAGGISYAIYQSVKKKKKQKEEQEKELKETQQLEEINKGIESQQQTDKESDKVFPVRNLDKVLNNSFNEIKGIKIYPAKKSSDPVQGHLYAEGFANIRTSPEVNNSQGIWDFWQDNLLGKISAGSSIGTIVSEQYDDMTPKMRWFKVKLSKAIDGNRYGWVRGDVVTFQPFTKKKTKSSFAGSFVETYNTSYPLGADVFPHPNWMIGYPAYANDVISDFEGNINLEI